MSLIDSLISRGYLKTSHIIKAFQRIKRIDFLPEKLKSLAEVDEALTIGWGQTISQPLVVAFMMELLQPNKGEKILDVGSGSGWTSALLAHIVSGGELNTKGKRGKGKGSGKIIAIDIIPELIEFGKENVSKYNFIEKGIVEFICADGSQGYEKEAPFDKILVSASAEKIPLSLKEQLKIDGRLVIPIINSIFLFIKKEKNKFEEEEYPGFVFVPLVEKNKQ